MKNLDLMKQSLETQRAGLFAAMQGGTEEEREVAFNNFAEGIQSSVAQQARDMVAEIGVGYNDEQILVERGIVKPLTSKEMKYFNAAVEKNSFENIDEVFPTTIVEDIFNNLTEEHPLLSRIDAKTTNALMKYIYADPTVKLAYWGAIPADIKQILINGFKTIGLESYKLSGFLAVPKGFFKLGPLWMATYVITLLKEIMSATLEIAVISGTGKLEPIGMIKKLSGAVDSVYPNKDEIELKDLEPISLAGIRAALAKAKTDNGRVSVLVNPMTYWSKLFTALAQRDRDNNWHLISLPTGEEIVQSHAVPEDKLVFGVLKNYLLAVSGQMEMNKYEETLAIEDMDLFIAKFHGNGVAKNANAFFVADITEMPSAAIPKLEPTADVKNPGTSLKNTP